MKTFTLPILPITLERNTDKKLADRGIDGIKLEYPWKQFQPRTLFSGAFIAAGTDGLGVSFCAEIPHGTLKTTRTSSKTRVFEDDCLEIFIRPSSEEINNSSEKVSHLSSLYYGWEINANGALLDYRVGIGDKETENNNEMMNKNNGIEILEKLCVNNKKKYDGGENVTGLLYDTIAGEKLLFDYDWLSHAVIRTKTEEEFWYLELFIPWGDFGLTNCPAQETVWHMTINRIDETGRSFAQKHGLKNANYGLLCLLDDVNPSLGAFHQPDKFAEFVFQNAGE